MTLSVVADEGARFVSEVVVSPVDVAVVDVRLGVVSGLDVAARLHDQLPAIRILYLTSFDDPQVTLDVRQGHANGILIKGSPASTLLSAIRTVHAGLTVFDVGPAQRLEPDPPREDQGVDPQILRGLTPRERLVLAHLRQGLSNAQIAKQTHYSESSVKGAVSSLMHKLDAESRTQVVLRAMSTTESAFNAGTASDTSE